MSSLIHRQFSGVNSKSCPPQLVADILDPFGANRVYSRAGHAIQLINRGPNALFMKLFHPELKAPALA